VALIKCTECGKEVSDKAAACPGCGAPTSIIKQEIARQPAKGTSATAALVIIGVLLIGGGALAYFIDSSRRSRDPVADAERHRAAAAIEFCDKRYKEMNADRQYTPDMLRFHSNTCKQMREEFKAKWGRDP